MIATARKIDVRHFLGYVDVWIMKAMLVINVHGYMVEIAPSMDNLRELHIGFQYAKLLSL